MKESDAAAEARLRWGWLLAVMLVVGCAACNSDGGGDRGSSPTFGEPEPDAVTDAALVDSAVEVVVETEDMSGPERRCVRLRLEQQPELAAVLTGSGAGVAGRAASLVADCGRALELADVFAGQLGGGGGAAEQACLTDVFLGLSATERVGVTAAVTGTGDDSDMDAAAEMADGVAECRDAER
ncbi:MAG: hypothetical protein JNK12_00275 [Acidimicrobiales bacterium]|nr:hypothetical protein [Acidimicrobiales bacterium]